jgi:hypothetical protein
LISSASSAAVGAPSAGVADSDARKASLSAPSSVRYCSCSNGCPSLA